MSRFCRLFGVLAVCAVPVMGAAQTLAERCGGYGLSLEVVGADAAATDAVAEVLRGRLGGRGLFGFSLLDAVTVEGAGFVTVHRAGRLSLGVDPGALLRRGGRMDIHLGLGWQETDEAAVGERLFADEDFGYLRVAEAPLIAEIGVASASVGTDYHGWPAVNFEFDAAGTRAFGQATSDHLGEVFAIVLDGQLLTAPVIQSPILGGSGIITGNYSMAEAEDLAASLDAGALTHEIVILQERVYPVPAAGAEGCAAYETLED